MSDYLLANPGLLSGWAFYGVIACLLVAEALFPKVNLQFSLFKRWANNVLLAVFNTIVMRYLSPLIGAAAAFFALEEGWGLFHGFNNIVVVMLGILILDCLSYALHRFSHSW